MARKKATKPPIVNGLDDTYIVEKSRPLMLMKEVPFALGELKVLDTYLSRINARDPEARTVRFSKEEYEDLMDIERMRPERLGKYVDSIMQKIITVPDENARGGWRKYTLFCMSECSKDEHDQWWIDLSCTSEAKKLFFNLEGVGYIRYQLKNILPLTSKYSVLLYIYLLDNRFRKSWEVSVEELRTRVFRCFAERYKEYKFFNQEILKKAIKEVNEKTDLTFEYESIRVGRSVGKIKFKLIKDEVILPEPELPQLPPSAPAEQKREFTRKELDRLDLIKAARDGMGTDYEFTDAEMEEIVVALEQSAWWGQSKEAFFGTDEYVQALRHQSIMRYIEAQYVYVKSRSKSKVKEGFKTYLVGAVRDGYAKVSAVQKIGFDVDEFFGAATLKE